MSCFFSLVVFCLLIFFEKDGIIVILGGKKGTTSKRE
jgi:hypothetical protein